MESILSLFIFHDSYVVSFLVLGITAIVVALLLSKTKSPESVIHTEMESDGQIEGALRRVLSEKQWVGAWGGSTDSGKVNALEEEILTKDRTIADLNKKLTQGIGGGAGGDDSELLARIAELEARLQEYEIIEDDIADLSLYRTENEKLKAELDRLKGMVGQSSDPEPEASVQVIDEAPAPEAAVVAPPANDHAVDGADLVAEFEKVVNNQDEIVSSAGEVGATEVEGSGDSGKVVVAGANPKIETKVTVHPKMKDIPPDSKEEAEVFIAELKSLKKDLKSE